MRSVPVRPQPRHLLDFEARIPASSAALSILQRGNTVISRKTHDFWHNVFLHFSSGTVRQLHDESS